MRSLSRRGTSIVVSTETRIRNIKVTSETITAYLVDGRVVSVPPAWSWRLAEATPAQRANFKVIGDGQGVHWPDVDEDISVEGMLHGGPARRPLTLTHFLDVKQQGHRKPPNTRLEQPQKMRRSTTKR